MAVSILKQSSLAEPSRAATTNATKRVTFADEITTIVDETIRVTNRIIPQNNITSNNTVMQTQQQHNVTSNITTQQILKQQNLISNDIKQIQDRLSETSITNTSTVTSKTGSRHRCQRCRKRYNNNNNNIEEEERRRRRRRRRRNQDGVNKKRSSVQTRRAKIKDVTITKQNDNISIQQQQQQQIQTPLVMSNNQQNVRRRLKKDDKENKIDNSSSTILATNTSTRRERKKKTKKKTSTSINVEQQLTQLTTTGLLSQVRRFLCTNLHIERSNRIMLEYIDARTIYKMLIECRKKDAPKKLRVNDLRQKLIQEELLYKQLIKKRNDQYPQSINMDRKEMKRKRTKLELFVSEELGNEQMDFVRELSKSQLERYALAAVTLRMRKFKECARNRDFRY